MKKVTISELKNNLSAYLKKVQAGTSVLVYDRNCPVARIEPLGRHAADSERLARLYAAGILRPPRKPALAAEALLARLRSGPKLPDADLVTAVIEERASGP